MNGKGSSACRLPSARQLEALNVTATGATTDQLRHDIDQGRTGDKVRFPDPAVAPLGTDEEAAGTPVDPRIVAETREAEMKMERPTDLQRSTEGGAIDVVWWLAMIAVAVAWSGAAWWLISIGE